MSIICKNVDFTYGIGTPFESTVLQNVNLQIEPGKFYVITGQTGAGKSTLIQLFSGLLRPTSGSVEVMGVCIDEKTNATDLQHVRRNIGLVFQFPESQLFAETVEMDLCFGPINFGFSKTEAKIQARKALQAVGLSENFLCRSPFTLSGGEMRKIAIAGVLAYMPQLLVLDEPTVGLDAKSKEELLNLFRNLHQQGMTIVLVTHEMDIAANDAEEMLVLANQTVIRQAPPREIFHDDVLLQQTGLLLPTVTHLQQEIEARCGFRLQKRCLCADELAMALAKQKEVIWE